MVSLAMILHDHRSLGKILARSCQDLGKHTHASWQACQDSCHWGSTKLVDVPSLCFILEQYGTVKKTLGKFSKDTSRADWKYRKLSKLQPKNYKWYEPNFSVVQFCGTTYIVWGWNDTEFHIFFLPHRKRNLRLQKTMQNRMPKVTGNWPFSGAQRIISSDQHVLIFAMKVYLNWRLRLCRKFDKSEKKLVILQSNTPIYTIFFRATIL